MLSEKFEVDERWVLSDVWLRVSNYLCNTGSSSKIKSGPDDRWVHHHMPWTLLHLIVLSRQKTIEKLRSDVGVAEVPVNDNLLEVQRSWLKGVDLGQSDTSSSNIFCTVIPQGLPYKPLTNHHQHHMPSPPRFQHVVIWADLSPGINHTCGMNLDRHTVMMLISVSPRFRLPYSPWHVAWHELSVMILIRSDGTQKKVAKIVPIVSQS